MPMYVVRVNVEVSADNELDAVKGFLQFLDKTTEMDIEVRDMLTLDPIAIYEANLDSIETGEIKKIWES